PRLDGPRPRRVHPRTEEGVHADAPVADRVPEALDDDRAIVGHGTRRLALLGEVAEQVARRPVVQPHLAQARLRRRAMALAEIAHEAPDGRAQLERPPRRVAVPEGHLAGLARRGRDDHAVVRDVLDAPAGRPEQEDLADATLVDHLLVELADPGRVLAGEDHA